MPAQQQSKKFTTFQIANRLYGIDVLRVQEVTRSLPIAEVPLAPNFVRGLINLRGQISTAISMRTLFKISGEEPNDPMNVVCKVGDMLISFLVDGVGDVLELDSEYFESTPETVPDGIKAFLLGVYKTPDNLLSIVDVDKIAEYFSRFTKESANENRISN